MWVEGVRGLSAEFQLAGCVWSVVGREPYKIYYDSLLI
jgi:hypothetical protein